MAAKRGQQTPTKALILPYGKTKGSEAIKLYEKTGFKLHPWQKKLLKNILAINSDGLYTHTKFGFAVPRRNGKTEIICCRMIYGLLMGETIKYTAHQAITCRETWGRMCMLLDTFNLPYQAYQSAGREEIDVEGQKSGNKSVSDMA